MTTERLKILFICAGGTVSGREVATLNLMRALRERGHDVRCVASSWGDGKLVERLNAEAFEHISLPLGFISKTLNWSALWMTLDQLRRVPGLWSGFRRYRREFEPDVVVQSNFHHIFLLWPLLDARKTFFHVHDDFPASDFYRRLFGFLNRRLCAVICVSRFIANSIGRLGIPPEKISAVYNGIAVEEILNEDESGSSLASHREGAVVVGIVGQVGPWKGHDDLLEALRELKGEGRPFSCIIYGSGEQSYRQSLMEKIAAYDLSAEVHFADYVKSLKEIYTTIDVCVVPSRVNEAFGMVAAEAAHFGVPVVATRRGALSEIVCDGETGFLVDAQSPGELAARLRSLIEDTALRSRMGEAARRGARRFTSQLAAQQVEEIFFRYIRPEGAVMQPSEKLA